MIKIIKKISNSKKSKNQTSSLSKWQTTCLLILTSIISLMIGFFVNNNINSYDKEVLKFINDFKIIENDYYEAIDKEKVLKKAMEAIINELNDPYSEVVDDSLSNTLNTELNGEYSGFGIRIANTKDNEIMIYEIIKDSPASKSNLKPGDIILKMDAKDVSKMSTTEFTAEVKKLNKQEIELTVIRNNKNISINIKRDVVVLDSVLSKTFIKEKSKIGYIYINVFAANTGKQFIKELNKLEKDGINSLIIDVRGNTGGHLTAVEYILNNMLDNKKIIYQLETKNNIQKIYSTGKKDKKYPISILIDKSSASGSEMLAISLKENLKAKIVGISSFGKGTVQEVGNTENTEINYKLTTKKWLSPKGNWIHNKGVKPDYKIELEEKYFISPSDDNDNQLQKAIEILK